MGIHDREYARPASGGFGGGRHSRKKLTVTTWLILICVGVFVIDGFLPATLVPVTQDHHLDATQIPEGPEQISFGKAVVNAEGKIISRPYEKIVDGVVISSGHAVEMTPFTKSLHFSTENAIYGVHYWRIIGFQFLHAGMWHLAFNMIGLYFFGPLVERHLGGKRFLAFYLLCGIFGALLYLILNLGGYIMHNPENAGVAIPGLLINDTLTPLVGASAGVFGILLAGAFLAPNIRVLVFGVLPMRLSTMAYALVGLALFTVLLGRNNAGGEAAHLGGAAAGWYFIRHPHHLNGFFDFLGKADPTSEHFAWRDKGAMQGDVDRILDKIHKKGLQSLSSKEKKILHDASKERREGS